MPTLDLSAYEPVPNTDLDANQITNGLARIQTVVNSLDDNNIASLSISKLSGYPSDGTKFAAGDGTWKTASPVTYRKVTAKTVSNTTTETDLFNGDLTVAANALGTDKVLRVTAAGDLLWNSGTSAPRFKLKLGAATLIDTGAGTGGNITASATRGSWQLEALIRNLTAATQWASFRLAVTMGANAAQAGTQAFTTGQGAWTQVASTPSAVALGGNSGAIDTTASTALVFTVTHPVASTSYETKLYAALAEVI